MIFMYTWAGQGMKTFPSAVELAQPFEGTMMGFWESTLWGSKSSYKGPKQGNVQNSRGTCFTHWNR